MGHYLTTILVLVGSAILRGSFSLDCLGGEKVKYAPVFGQQRMNEVENG
jgi:hypothetical protein